MLKPLLALFLMGGLFCWGENALSPQEIIRKADEKLRGKSSLSEMEIKTVRPSWERSMTLKSWTLGEDYAMVLILTPAQEKGTVFLKKEKEMWNWVPRISRNIKLPPSMMMQSWMGTDFTNDDLVKQSSMVSDYEHELGKDSVINGMDCWNLILTPKPDAPVVWGKISIWVSKEEYLQLKTEFFDEDGELVNLMLASKPKKFDGVLLPSYMEYIPVNKPGHKTVMEYKSLKFNNGLKESFFSIRNMKQVK